MDLTIETLFNDSNIISAIINRVNQTRKDTIYWKQYLAFRRTTTRVFKDYIGNDGWYNRTSNSQWVHLKGGILSLPPSCLQIVGDHSTMKGTGMLLAGSVQGDGQINSYIGVAKNSIRRISQGIYIISHTIGNVKYAALATWAGNDQRGYINVFEKTATSFKVSVRVYGNADDNVDHDFDFAVFGEM